MDENNWMAKRFEENRTHLAEVARRMHGSLSETDDAVQEAWLRFSRLIPAESRTLVLLPAITVTYFGS